ncbi:unnamed protein product [Brassicogethes aeneus]|uniref:C2H2-type domain-containing protein n=1 Tax=Brassicogethes aeneus TaxID=1431903 RepID=A0A9P0AVZ7_BRAAE|nr:unnamed protein product [Brassicogethes aeneus]
MEQILLKKEPEELVEDFNGAILMNYNKPRQTSADQVMPSTYSMAIKKELNDNDNSMNHNESWVKKESKTSTNEENDFSEAEQFKMKFKDKKEIVFDKGCDMEFQPAKFEIMKQVVVKKETEDLVDYSYSMNYDKPRPTFADQEMPSTSGIAIKQETKDDNDNSMGYDESGVKEEPGTSTDEVDYFDVAEPVELKFNAEKKMFVLKGSDSEVVNKEILAKTGLLKAGKETGGVGEEKLKCEICTKNFKTKMGLISHDKYFHRKDELEKLTCNKCDYETVNKSNLKKHLKIHDKDNYLKCHFCQYKAAQLVQLSAHILSYHKLENKLKITSKIYQCTKCTYSTVIKTNYDNHVKVCLKLKNVKWYKCEVCDYKTIDTSNFHAHKKTHNKIKQLECLFCPHKSNIKKNLDNHILTKHLDLLNESNKTFITSKVHACNHCQYKTTNTIYLKKHLNHNH